MALDQLRPRARRACSSRVWRLLLGDSAWGPRRRVLRPNPSAGCLYRERRVGRLTILNGDPSAVDDECGERVDPLLERVEVGVM